MSSERRAPWWYSGDDESEAVTDIDASPAEGWTDGSAQGEGPHDEALGDGAPDEHQSGEPPSAGPSAMDWTALIAGAAKMVDWAAERVMAPHAEHVDPADHPECMVCRTVALIGDPVGLMGGSPDVDEAPDADPQALGADAGTRAPVTAAAPAPSPDAKAGAQPIRWLPIVESGD